MYKTVLTLAALLALTACSVTPDKQAAAPAAPAAAAKPALSDEAKAALAKAEDDVKTAKKARAYWKTADDAIKSAKKAAESADSAGVIKHAKTVSEQVKLGLEQKNYASTEL